MLLILIALLLINPVQAELTKAGPGLSCLITRSLDLDSLVDEAGIIFAGEFKSYTTENHSGLQVRKLNFNCKEAISGIANCPQDLSLLEFAKTISPFSDGQIQQNTEYVFFFHSPSKLGLTSLVGAEQGQVEVLASGEVKYAKRLARKQKKQSNNLLSLLRTSSEQNEPDSYANLKKFCKQKKGN